jgi:signal transduction histidine kinase
MRIALMFTLSFSIILILSMLFVFFAFQQILLTQSDSGLRQFNNYIANIVNDHQEEILDLPSDERLDYIADSINTYTDNNIFIHYELEDNFGNMVASSEMTTTILAESQVSNSLDLFVIIDFSAEDEITSIDDFTVSTLKYDNTSYYYLPSTIIISDDYYINVQLLDNIDESFKDIQILFILLCIAAVVGVIATILIGIYGTANALQPLVKISNTAKTISENNLHTRIPETGHKDEVDRLIISFNEMLRKLEHAFETQQQFVSDASHELRIPLTIMSGYIDIIGSWGQDDIELQKESFEAIQHEVEHMKKLINDLLMLARIENEKLHINFSPVDPNSILLKVYDEFRMIDPNHIYQKELLSEGLIMGDPQLLTQGIRALLENAQKYTPEGKMITLKSNCENNIYTIIVKDQGIGISAENINKITQRFYRADKARSKETGGTGLGLSIVSSIVNLHHGEMEIESEINKGTTIKLIFNCTEER